MVLVYLAGVYGGYFVAAQGILLVGILGVFMTGTIQNANAMKNILVLGVNIVAAASYLLFAFGRINWAVVAIIAVSSLIGGVIGSKVGRRLSPPVLRGVIFALGPGGPGLHDRQPAEMISPVTFHYLESADDPRVSDYTQLTDVHLRKLREPAEGMYIAESSRVLRRALAAGHRPRSFFLAEKWLRGPGRTSSSSTRTCRPTSAAPPCSRRSPASTCTAAPWPPCTGRRRFRCPNCWPAPAGWRCWRTSWTTPTSAPSSAPRPPWAWTPSSSRRAAGTRCTGAASGSAWARCSRCPWARLESWPGDLAVLREQGFTVAAMELTDDAVDLDELAARNPDRLALVLGTEGAGMSAETLAAVDLAVKIPMRAGVDSLNVAAASAVAFWELRPRD